MRLLYSKLFIFGIALGVMAAVLAIGIGQAQLEQEKIRNEAMKKHTNFYKICITNNDGESIGVRGMSYEQVKKIKNEVASLAKTSVLSELHFKNDIRYGTEFLDARPIMSEEELVEMGLIDIVNGRFISNEDNLNKSKVCVITESLFEYLGGNDNTSVMINGYEFRVIGTFRPLTSSDSSDNFMGIDIDRAVFIPVASAFKYIYNEEEPLSMVIMMLAAKVQDEDALIKIREILPGIQTEKEDSGKLTIISGAHEIEGFYSKQIQMYIAFFTVSLLVLLTAGMNIIQIATANVMDNKKQIGIKIALGAKRRDIMFEISKDIIWCCLKGGFIGVAISGLIHFTLNCFIGEYYATFDILTALSGVLLSFIVGFVTSLIPARKAAGFEPSRLLRQEG